MSTQIRIMTTRALVMDIVKSGSLLYDILIEEPKLKDERTKVTSKYTDFDEMERSLKNDIDFMRETILATERELLQTQADEKSAQSALTKRKIELERSEERLATIMNVRPAYMDEYEVMQKELQNLFVTYVEQFRNLQWLETQLESFHLNEQQKHDEVQRRMLHLQHQFHEEEMKFLQGGDMVSLSLENEQELEMEEYGQKILGAESYYPLSLRTSTLDHLLHAKTEISL